MSKPRTHVSIDVETRSEVDLRKVGAYRYFEHPSTDVLCLAYSGHDRRVRMWHRGEPFPDELEQWITRGAWLSAWNASFERLAWTRVLTPRYGFPALLNEGFYCTQAKAMAMSLPAKLADCARALGVDQQKDTEGHKLMLKMCKPLRNGGWLEDPESLERLARYCAQDVVVESTIGARVRDLPEDELLIYQIGEKINDRGVLIDQNLVQAAIAIVQRRTRAIDAECLELTKGRIRSPRQVAELVAFLRARGLVLDDLRKEAVANLLQRPDLDPVVRRLLELRQEAGKTSTAKLKTMRDAAGADGRLRGMYRYHGAGTGRFQSMLVNLANLPQPTVRVEEAAQKILFTPAVANLDVVSSAIRGCLVAPPGKSLVIGDWSQIEARLLAWIAQQEDVVEAFRAFDAGTGPDIYTTEAAKLIEKPIEEIDTKRRQLGKVAVLACGFYGGKGAVARMAEKFGLPMEECQQEMTVKRWRETNPNSVRFWHNLERAAIAAVLRPGSVTMVTHTAAPITFEMGAGHLWMRLPSRRVLCYPFAEVRTVQTPWGEDRACVTHMGQDPYTKAWKRVQAHAGRLTENVVQAMAADILRHTMRLWEEKGNQESPIVMHVYDEIVLESEERMSQFDAGRLAHFMAGQSPDWASGLPLAAEVQTVRRYTK